MNKKFNHDFAKEARTALHLRISYVANLCGITDNDLEMIEAGSLEPTNEVLLMLSKISGFPVEAYYLPKPTPVEEIIAFQRLISTIQKGAN